MKQNVIELLSGDLSEYKSIPFWSWNSFLGEDTLVKQIEEMKSAGIGGFIMHARTGLQEEYLGEKWFSCIDACLKKAKELQMNAWIYDENGWPSGFVGGKLLEEERYRARFLEYAVGAFDADAFACYVECENGYQRVEQAIPGVKQYYNVYLRVSPANTDILNPEVVDAFIQETHEKYYARFADSFGKELVGFFTDEPQYYRWATPYTHSIEPIFAQYGEDVRDGLIWLFVHDERGYQFRTRYFEAMNRLYVENFYKKLYDWCEAHNCKLTGHSVEESFFAGQMLGGASVMPSYEYEHIPGIDWLGKGCGPELMPKQVGSVASQLGKKLVLTETYGCSGYDVNPRELKAIAQYQYFSGVSLMCQHLYPYTLACGGKRDHPPVFSPHGNWFEGFRSFNDYFTRLGCIIANTEEIYDVAILNPMRGAWLDYVREEDAVSVEKLQRAFDEFVWQLRKKGILFQLVDERLLEKYGSIENGNLRMGKCVYDKLVIPDMRSLAGSTVRLLEKYCGGLILLGDITHVDGLSQNVSLTSNMRMEDLEKEKAVQFFCPDNRSILTARKGSCGDFLFIQNLSLEEASYVECNHIAEAYCQLDIQTLQTTPISNRFVLQPGEGKILLRDSEAKPTEPVMTVRDVTDAFCVTDISENYLVLDYAQLAKDGETFGGVQPIPGLFESLLREDYKGRVSIRQTFFLEETMPLTLVMERSKLTDACVNGHPICFHDGKFDVNFVEADIGALVKAGENVFVYSLDYFQHDGVHFALFDPLATESLRNCLYFDTAIEAAYLKGNFVVNENNVLSARQSLPPVTTQLYRHGYPFFKGEVKLTGEILWDGKGRSILEGQGHFQMATIIINGCRKEWTLDTRCDITDILEPGKNTVEIILKSSLRNLFGPHHFAPEPEPNWATPHSFEMRGEWIGDRRSPNYTDTYHSVPFGIDKILCITHS